MAEKLEDLLPAFSSSNRARCFTHILNLIAKSLLKQFDVAKKSGSDDELNEEEAELLNLAKDSETEELTTDKENGGNDEEIEEEDDLEDWVDEVAALTPEEREMLEDDIRPVKMVLVKVSHKRYFTQLRLNLSQLRKLAFKIVHSSTILLPAWKACLVKLNLPLRIMSRDVTTRWNSTYDMLSFVVTYRKAIELLTSERMNDLRPYELMEDEWVIVSELCNTLKVRRGLIMLTPTILMSEPMLYRSSRTLQHTSRVLHLICRL
jgi:hypothetical protein